MKTTYTILLSLCLMFGSCKKFLDEKQNSLQGPLNSVKACEAALDYSQLNTYFPSEAEVYADNYYLTDAGWAALSSDALRNIYLRNTTSQRPISGDQWLTSYNKIYIANIILETLNTISAGATTKEQADYNTVKGMALFLRAFTHYQLASIYAKPYDDATASNDPGIPVRLTSDINAKSGRGTVKQVYDQVIKDLQEASGLLPVTADIFTRPNKGAAYAALARTYISMRDYTNASLAANAALQLNSTLINYNTLSLTSATPFDFNNPEVFFHSRTAYDMYVYSRSYVNPELYALYSANDLRRQIFFKNKGDNTYRFTGNYGPDFSTGGAAGGAWNGLATDEIYLIRAECYARAGNKEAAMTDLNALLTTRWNNNNGTTPYQNMTATTAVDALSKILTERRKELCFRGVRWTDLRRLNKDPDFAITLKRTVNGNTATLPPNDLRYVILIPQDVITFSTLEQNPR